MQVAKDTAHWRCDRSTGSGEFTVGDTTSGGYTYKSRFEGGPGSNPEQLIAAAHAACFTMALTGALAGEGNPVDWLETDAELTLRPLEGQPTITRIMLTTRGAVPWGKSGLLRRGGRDCEGTLPGQPRPRRSSRDHS
jgi:osmotically inducible protein OsmC